MLSQLVMQLFLALKYMYFDCATWPKQATNVKNLFKLQSMKIHVLLYATTFHSFKRDCHTNLEMHQCGTVIQTDLSFDRDSQDHQISVGQ